MLPELPARRSKFYYYLGKIICDFPKKNDTFLGKILFFLVSVPLSKCSTVGQGRSGIRFPLVQCRLVFSCVWVCVFWISPVGFSWINWAFVLRFRSSACTACVYHFFECTFGPTVAWSISPASVALLFYVSVFLHVPHASITLLSALLAPLSLGRSFNSIRKRVFWELWFCVHCRSVGLSWICCCCWWWCCCCCCCFVVVVVLLLLFCCCCCCFVVVVGVGVGVGVCVGVGVSVVVVVGVVFLKKAIINFYWCKCLGAFSRPGWTYFVTSDLHGSSSYFLTIPNLGLRCTNIPAQYPMLVFRWPRHTSEPRRSDDNPGGAILMPRLQAKICSNCHGLTIETRLTIEHV